MKACYLSGPITLVDGQNHEAFNRAAERLRAEGWFVLNPVDGSPSDEEVEAACRAAGVDDFRDTPFYARLLEADIAKVLQADTVFTLPGHESSRGAAVEIAVAEICGKEIIEYEDHVRSRWVLHGVGIPA
jgi:Domain of unknown function (DUF4406)